MKTTKKFSLALIFSALFIAACGNKGDLFLPEQSGQNSTEQTQTEADATKKKGS